MITLSSPVELLFLLCFIATWTSVVVRVILVVCSLSVFLSMYLFILCVLCLTVLANCLLNTFAICGDEVNVFLFESYCVAFGLCCFGVVLVFCRLIRVLSSKEYGRCVCDSSVCRSVLSICVIYVFV